MQYVVIRSWYFYITSILNHFMFSSSHTNHFPDTDYIPPCKSSQYILLGVSLSPYLLSLSPLPSSLPPLSVFQVLVSLIPHNIKETT